MSCIDKDDLSIGWARASDSLQVSSGDTFSDSLELTPAYAEGATIETRFTFFLGTDLCEPRFRTTLVCGIPGASACAGAYELRLEPISGPPVGPEQSGTVAFGDDPVPVDFDLRPWRGQEMTLVFRFVPDGGPNVDQRAYFDAPRLIDLD